MNPRGFIVDPRVEPHRDPAVTLLPSGGQWRRPVDVPVIAKHFTKQFDSVQRPHFHPFNDDPIHWNPFHSFHSLPFTSLRRGFDGSGFRFASAAFVGFNRCRSTRSNGRSGDRWPRLHLRPRSVIRTSAIPHRWQSGNLFFQRINRSQSHANFFFLIFIQHFNSITRRNWWNIASGAGREGGGY